MSFVSSLKLLKLLGLAASVPDIAADNPNGDRKILARGVSTFSINSKPAVNNGLKKLKILLLD